MFAEFLKALICPTYALADYCKAKYKKEALASGIKKLNIAYLILSLILGVALYFFSPGIIYKVLGDYNHAALMVTGAVIWVFPLSRANEISYAFYRDAIDKLNGKKSNSNLLYGERIQLAMKSYVELIVNFASIYILLPPSCFDNDISSYTDALYFSGVTITTLGYGDISASCFVPQFLSVYEVLCGFMLIVVSFAVYTGRSIETNGESA